LLKLKHLEVIAVYVKRLEETNIQITHVQLELSEIKSELDLYEPTTERERIENLGALRYR
jgi:hypothetical protein